MNLLESIIMCDLITDNDKRLKIDQDKYSVTDTIINRLRAELIKTKVQIQSDWDKEKEAEFIRQCQKEYIVEINS